MKSRLIVVLALSFIMSSTSPCWSASIRCASTTSTQNSGLFDYLLPIFAKESGIEVQVVAVGTGAALRLGKNGDVDMVLVHARDTELKMMAAGWFVDRFDVMYNDFIIVGPPADSAAVGSSDIVAECFTKIRNTQSLFVSRGDDSGTHKKEVALWNESGFRPDPGRHNWYLSVGQGMAKTLRVAAEKKAYTLTDRGTWLALKDKEKLDLTIIFQGDPLLFNQYGAMAVNPAKHPHAQYKDAMVFVRWLISDAGQQVIGSFKDARGNKLFIPNAR